MNLKRSKNVTISYKIFLLIMIFSNLYMVLCESLNLYSFIISCVLLIYLVFRFYLLNKLENEACEAKETLSEFLKKARESFKKF